MLLQSDGWTEGVHTDIISDFNVSPDVSDVILALITQAVDSQGHLRLLLLLPPPHLCSHLHRAYFAL